MTSSHSDPSPGLETSLYRPVKRFLESLGYEVKGEIGGCDLVGVSQDGTVVVIGELKLRFNLDLLLQAVDRMPACDEVWLAVRASGRKGRERDPRVRKLCRLLGFGLLGVTHAGQVEILVLNRALAAQTRSAASVETGRRAPTSTRRSRLWWKCEDAHHDRLSATGSGLRGSSIQGTWAPA